MGITESLASAEPKYYVWWFPGSPVKVHLDLGTVKRLQGRLKRDGQPVIEQGLLFGRTHGKITEIYDFQTASNGNIREMVATSAIEERKHLLVGYYRTQQEETLQLNDKDVSLAEALFPDPFHVFLVIQSAGFGTANASFFFRAGGRLRAEFPIMEFPFDAELLAAEERGKADKSRPIALEKSLVLPLPVAPALVQRRYTRVLRIALVCLCALSLLAAIAVFGLQRFADKSARSLPDSLVRQSPATLPHASIGLHVERQNGDLLLTWNRQSAQITGATSGALLIQDGDASRQIPLDATQVSGGSILYSPVNDQVQMWLTVATPASIATELVMVLLPKVGQPPVKAPGATKTSPAPEPRLDELATVSRMQPPKPFVAPDGHQAAQPSQESPIASPLTLNTRPNFPTALPTVLSELQQPAPSPEMPSLLTLLSPAGPLQTLPHATPEYYPPVAIAKVMPNFPPVLKSIALKPETVDVKVTIDNHGKVIKAEPILQKDVSNFMAVAAAHAARLWKFQPAQSGGQPVTSEMMLRFVFKQ